METMLRMDGYMKRHMPWFILGAVTVGVLFPGVFAPMQAYLSWLLAMLTFSNSLGGGFGDLFKAFQRPLPILVTFVTMHLVMPALALGIGRLLFPQEVEFVNGLVLQFTLPVGVNSLMWVGMSGGNLGLCLSLVLLDTLLAPFTIPMVLQLMVGATVQMDVPGMMRSLLLMVGLPAMLAMLLHRIDGGRPVQKMKRALALPSKLVLMVIVTVNGSKCADFFRSFDPWMLMVVATILTLSAGAYALGYLVARWMKKDFPTTLTLTVDMGFRNISAGIVLAQQYFPLGTLLPVSLLPLFQQFLVSLVVKVVWKSRFGREYAAGQETSCI